MTEPTRGEMLHRFDKLIINCGKGLRGCENCTEESSCFLERRAIRTLIEQSDKPTPIRDMPLYPKYTCFGCGKITTEVFPSYNHPEAPPCCFDCLPKDVKRQLAKPTPAPEGDLLNEFEAMVTDRIASLSTHLKHEEYYEKTTKLHNQLRQILQSRKPTVTRGQIEKWSNRLSLGCSMGESHTSDLIEIFTEAGMGIKD